MQKLLLKLKNVPKDASQVLCSTSSVLNREETLSVQDKVLDNNNPEVNLRQRTGGSDLRVLSVVYVKKGGVIPLSFIFKIKELVSSVELKTQWFLPEGFYK